MSFPITGVSHMLRRALNTLDYRLMDHGERVAYIVYNLFKADGIYSSQQLKEICYLSLFHDIGAYKTEFIDSMLVDTDESLEFEIRNVFSHSAYSYLFLKNFTFVQKYVDAILFHHFTYPKLELTDCKNKLLASRLFIADRLDILFVKGLIKTPADMYKYLDSPVFCKEEVEKLKTLETQSHILTKIFEHNYLEELFGFLNTRNLSGGQIASLVEMLPYTIDFRSESTVTHTVSTVEITMLLADLFDLDEKEKELIFYGATLHDIGKISVSLMILEKQSALSDYEFSVMKDHVSLSEYILKGHVSDKVLNIAIRHHEKLDGSGYPYGLKAEDLSLSERIVAVADILSALLGKRSYKQPFSKEKVCEVVCKMADDGKICRRVVDKALENYTLISQKVEECSDKALKRYFNMTSEYEELLQKYAPLI